MLLIAQLRRLETSRKALADVKFSKNAFSAGYKKVIAVSEVTTQMLQAFEKAPCAEQQDLEVRKIISHCYLRSAELLKKEVKLELLGLLEEQALVRDRYQESLIRIKRNKERCKKHYKLALENTSNDIDKAKIKSKIGKCESEFEKLELEVKALFLIAAIDSGENYQYFLEKDVVNFVFSDGDLAGFTPFLYYLTNYVIQPDVINNFLQAGADATKRSQLDTRMTPLYLAIEQEYPSIQIIRSFIVKGAKSEIGDIISLLKCKNRTPELLQLLIDNKDDSVTNENLSHLYQQEYGQNPSEVNAYANILEFAAKASLKRKSTSRILQVVGVLQPRRKRQKTKESGDEPVEKKEKTTYQRRDQKIDLRDEAGLDFEIDQFSRRKFGI